MPSPFAFELSGSPEITFSETSAQAAGVGHWMCRHTDNLDTARDTVRTASPAYLAAGTQVLVRSTIKTIWRGPDAIECEVGYTSEQAPQSQEDAAPGDWKLRWQASAGQQKMTHSLETVQSKGWAPNYDPPEDLKGAVGWDGEKIQGADVPVPKLDIVITRYYAHAAVNAAMARDFARKVGYTNDAEWLGFAKRELAFMGGSGEAVFPLAGGTRAAAVPVELLFACSENRTGIDVGDIAGMNKKGWEYLWARYKKVSVGGKLVVRPIEARVERMLPEMDYAAFFGIGP